MPGPERPYGRSGWEMDAPTSQVGDALGDQHGRTREQDAVVLGPGDGERAAGDVDAVRRTAGRVVEQRGDHRDGASAGAAGAGLARAALVDPHRDVVLAAAYDELDVDAVGIERVVVLRLLVE